MKPFLRQAEEILDVAAHGTGELAIIMQRHGGVRMVDPAGWSLPSLYMEYAAEFVYKVERWGGMLQVEGWDGRDRCLLQRRMAPPPLISLPGMPANRRQCGPLQIARPIALQIAAAA